MSHQRGAARSSEAIFGISTCPAFDARHRARALVAVQRKRIGAQLLGPESFLEGLREASLPVWPARLRGPRNPSQRQAENRGVWPSTHSPAPRRARSAAVRSSPFDVENGVVRVLPTLLDETASRAAVLDEAVSVCVAVTIHPFESRLDVRPDRADEIQIARCLVILTGQRHEQRRRVDRAVVVPEGNLAEPGHLAVTLLVDDLAGLRFTL